MDDVVLTVRRAEFEAVISTSFRGRRATSPGAAGRDRRLFENLHLAVRKAAKDLRRELHKRLAGLPSPGSKARNGKKPRRFGRGFRWVSRV